MFKVPPLASAQGYKAADWDKEPIWTGRCRVVRQGDEMKLLLEHTDKRWSPDPVCPHDARLMSCRSRPVCRVLRVGEQRRASDRQLPILRDSGAERER